MTDISYTQDKMFTTFYANTEEGEYIWNTMYTQLGSIPKFPNSQVPSVMSQIRKAGYTVSKAKKVTKKEMKEIFDELGILGL